MILLWCSGFFCQYDFDFKNLHQLIKLQGDVSCRIFLLLVNVISRSFFLEISSNRWTIIWRWFLNLNAYTGGSRVIFGLFFLFSYIVLIVSWTLTEGFMALFCCCCCCWGGGTKINDSCGRANAKVAHADSAITEQTKLLVYMLECVVLLVCY